MGNLIKRGVKHKRVYRGRKGPFREISIVAGLWLTGGGIACFVNELKFYSWQREQTFFWQSLQSTIYLQWVYTGEKLMVVFVDFGVVSSAIYKTKVSYHLFKV